MEPRDFSGWMWGEALALLDRAERLQRQFFHVADAWEPPVDIIDAGEELRVQVALPGVQGGDLTVVLEPGAVTVSALRAFPSGDGNARIHRLEIPYGRFARRIGLPAPALELESQSFQDGVLTLVFRRMEAP